MIRQRIITRLLHLTVGLTFFIAITNPPQRVQAAPQMSENPQGQHDGAAPMAVEQVTNIPYYTLRDGMSSTLTLNNVGPSPTPVRVSLFNTEGRAQVLRTITVEPHSFKQIQLRDVIESEDFDSGNIEVAFSAPPMFVTCQVSVFSIEKRVSFESREQDMMDFMSSTSNGILWLPDAGAEGFLAVTNTARNKVALQLTVGSEKNVFTLSSRETRLVKLNEDLDRRAGVANLVKLHHNGMPGDIITTGFVLNLEKGHSSGFPMLDPSIMFSNKLAGAHFRFGQPDPSEGFPVGTAFRAPLLLANVGSHSVNAHVSVDYTLKEEGQMSRWTTEGAKENAPAQEAGDTKDKFNTVVVKHITIAPEDVQRIELAEELARLGVAGPIEEAGVDIAYDAAPGTLIGQLTSVDQSGDYSFEVPIKDPAAMNEMMEGIYPWTIGNGTHPVLHLKNASGDSVRALLLFELPRGGIYNPDPIILEPYQSIAIDIQKLKDSRKPDVLGRGFPADAIRGQVHWRQEIPYSMIGRLEETNIRAGIASSFSCGGACCNNYQEFAELLPSSINGEAGTSATLTPWIHVTSGTGSTYLWPPRAPPGSWSSTDSSVASVS